MTINEAELDRLEGLHATYGVDSYARDAALDFFRAAAEKWPELIAAARALPAEIRAREEAEREALIAEENDKVSREYLEIDARRIKAAEARATAAEQRAEEVTAENTRIRAALALSDRPCAYCSLPAAEWSKCQHGFPGCDRSDDAMGCPELGAAMERDALQQRVKALEETLAPFADEAGMWGELVPDDHAPVCVEMGHTDARYYGSAAKYTVGDLRRAAAIRARSTQEKSND